MKSILFIIIGTALNGAVVAQHIDAHTRTANNLYREHKFDRAQTEYEHSVQATNDPVTIYNLGNAYFRTSKFDEATKTFDVPATNGTESSLKEKAYYNKGVSLTRQNKLEESIQAYKSALILDPTDNDARINLQKALLELKKRQPPEDKKKDDERKKNKNNQQPQQPKSNLTKKQVEQLLKALQQREQQVQQKMQNNKNRTAGQQEKDW
jgi:Ca-activated chloride channel family protein